MTMSDTTDTTEILPTLQEELNRKGFETLAMLVNKLDVGKITEAQFSCGIDVLYGVCAGITDPDLIDMMSEIREKADESYFENKVFLHEPSGRVMIARRKADDYKATVYTLKNNSLWQKSVRDFSDQPNSVRACTNYIRDLEKRLGERGFNPL